MSSGLLRRICLWRNRTYQRQNNLNQNTKAHEGKAFHVAPLQQDLDLRQACRLMALTTMQKILAGMNPNCAVRNPITHMMRLLTPASAQPSQ